MESTIEVECRVSGAACECPGWTSVILPTTAFLALRPPRNMPDRCQFQIERTVRLAPQRKRGIRLSFPGHETSRETEVAAEGERAQFLAGRRLSSSPNRGRRSPFHWRPSARSVQTESRKGG